MTIHNKDYTYSEVLLQKAFASHHWTKGEELALYDLLGRCYVIQDKAKEVENLYTQALHKYPEEDRLHASFALFYLDRGDVQKAKRYFTSANKLRRHYVNAVTHYNYAKLKKMVLDRGVQLVCVQYPLRSVTPLKQMLRPYAGTVFVDNESLFKSAVEREGYDAFFKDNFAGDFGHCTEKGNRMLAQNIFQTLQKRYFNE